MNRNHATATTNTGSNNQAWLQMLIGRYMSNVIFILLRLPSLIFADFILLNSEYISERLTAPKSPPGHTLQSEASHLNYLFSFVLAKFVIVTPLFVCGLIFTLNKIYVLRIYKILSLLALPFLFTFLTEYVHKHRLYCFDHELPKFVLLCAVYALISTLTISIYNDIYRNFIIDKHKIYSYYQMHRMRGNEVLTNFIDILSNQTNYNTSGSSSEESNGSNPLHKSNQSSDSLEMSWLLKWLNFNKRAMYIMAYSMSSFYLNEMPYLVKRTQDQQLEQKANYADEEPQIMNIMSLGYLLLLTYDLASNFEQILLRVLIQLKLLGRLISQYGLNNFLSFNWFERLKVPYFLRLYFFLKLMVFTLNFVQNKQYYLNYDEIMSNENLTDQFSLYNSLLNFVRALNQNRTYTEISSESRIYFQMTSSLSENSENSKTTKFLFDSVLDQFVYIFDTPPPITTTTTTADHDTTNLFDLSMVYVRFLVLNLSNTLISIACTTSLLSYQFYLLGILVNKITAQQSTTDANNNNIHNRREMGGAMGGGQMPEADLSNVGDVAAVLFFLLSIQSGLTSLLNLQRIEKFFKNYSLLFIAILHYFHTSIDSQLMTLSASSKPNWQNQRHVRVLSVCVLLIVIPVVILFFLWTNFQISTWLLAASAFNIELIVKMSVSLLLYSLFLIDSRRLSSSYDKMKKKTDIDHPELSSQAQQQQQDNTIFDNLDDYIYAVKSFGHIFEFLVAIFLFFNGAYILLFESYGFIRAVMMTIHAYFHIWCQAQKGWSVFIKRRTALSKLRSLSRFDRKAYANRMRGGVAATNDATSAVSENELESEFEEKMRDVCAICFCELSAYESLITNCNHIFHTTCLRKWLYLQDTCPMCHQVVYQQQNQQ